MPVTRIWEYPEKKLYAILTTKIFKIGDEEIKMDVHFHDKGQEIKLKLIAELYDVGIPLSLAGPMYLSGDDLIKALSESGVIQEEIERIKKKMSYISSSN